MSDNLVGRLRFGFYRVPSVFVPPVQLEAADEIERLTAESADLKAEAREAAEATRARCEAIARVESDAWGFGAPARAAGRIAETIEAMREKAG